MITKESLCTWLASCRPHRKPHNSAVNIELSAMSFICLLPLRLTAEHNLHHQTWNHLYKYKTVVVKLGHVVSNITPQGQGTARVFFLEIGIIFAKRIRWAQPQRSCLISERQGRNIEVQVQPKIGNTCGNCRNAFHRYC